MSEILKVENLKVTFDSYLGEVQAVRGVDFSIHAGETVAIVGESGCGKSVTVRTIMGLLGGAQIAVSADELRFRDRDLRDLSPSEMRRLRGSEMAMVFQDPMSSLNPTMRIGKQITESLELHRNLTGADAEKEAIRLLEEVGIPHPSRRLQNFPHQLSGGMRQRVMIAIAISCQPSLLFADEPTTALDVTIQAQILELLLRLQKKTQTSIVLITHDLAVVASTCERVLVMYAGKIVEQGTVEQIFFHPQHPYTRALLDAVPNPKLSGKKALSTIAGSPPNLRYPPKGCAFHPRCPHAMKVCAERQPPCRNTIKQQQSACWMHHPEPLSQLDKTFKKKIDPWNTAAEDLA